MHYQNFEMQLELFSNHCHKTNQTGNENEASNQSDDEANYVTRSKGGKKNPCTLHRLRVQQAQENTNKANSFVCL